MKASTVVASLIVGAALFVSLPTSTAGEDAGLQGPVPESRSTVGWMIVNHGHPPVPAVPGEGVRSGGAPRATPANASPEKPWSAEIGGKGAGQASAESQPVGDRTADAPSETAPAAGAERGGAAAIQAEAEMDSFLVPVLHGGFWAMPPGGMTRFLIPSRIPVNPQVTLVQSNSS